MLCKMLSLETANIFAGVTFGVNLPLEKNPHLLFRRGYVKDGEQDKKKKLKTDKLSNTLIHVKCAKKLKG